MLLYLFLFLGGFLSDIDLLIIFTNFGNKDHQNVQLASE